MSAKKYRGEGFGTYYTRLQEKLEQEGKQKNKEQQRSSSTNQVDILDLGYLSDQEVQTEEVVPSHIVEDVATAHQLQVTPDEEERNRNRFVGLLAWSQIQRQASRKLKFQPLSKKPGCSSTIARINGTTP